MPLDALPDVLIPYQRRFWEELDRWRVLVVEKSRRTGFTRTVAAPAVEHAAKAATEGGEDVYYLGYDHEMGREFIDYVAMWAKIFQQAAGDVQEFIFPDPDNPDRDIKAFRVKFDSGFEVQALPSVPRALRGKQGLVILDEAAFMNDLAEMLKAALALLMWGGKVVIISTHKGETNPFNVLIEEIRAGKKPYGLMRLTFDEALADGLYKYICRKLGEEWTPAKEAAWRAQTFAEYGDDADEELNVIPNPASGAYIPLPMITARTQPHIPVLRLQRDLAFSLWAEPLRKVDIDGWIGEHLDPVLAKLDPDLPHCFGWDFARSGDLTVLMPLAIGRYMVCRVPFTLEMRGMPFAQQRQVLWHVIDKLPRKRAGKMDARGNGQQIAEETVDRWGAWIEPVMLSETWYRENMPAFKKAFEDATIEIPRDRETVEDISIVKIVRGVPRVPDHTVGADGKKRHGDAAIAGVLAIAASRADPEVYGYEPVRRADAEREQRHAWRDRPDPYEDEARTPARTIMPGLRGGAF